MNRRMFLKWAGSLLAPLPFGLSLPDEPEPVIMSIDMAKPGSDRTGFFETAYARNESIITKDSAGITTTHFFYKWIDKNGDWNYSVNSRNGVRSERF